MKTTILVQMHDAKRSHAVAFASVEILVQMHDAKRSHAVAFVAQIGGLLSKNTPGERLISTCSEIDSS